MCVWTRSYLKTKWGLWVSPSLTVTSVFRGLVTEISLSVFMCVWGLGRGVFSQICVRKNANCSAWTGGAGAVTPNSSFRGDQCWASGSRLETGQLIIRMVRDERCVTHFTQSGSFIPTTDQHQFEVWQKAEFLLQRHYLTLFSNEMKIDVLQCQRERKLRDCAVLW